ncbi:hypothetical protein GobsT_75620 [Gemmata obscuriglobus]|uniref:DUF433 domain-containing protein n=1 Tax=Gemmata obscuriglobus TaxID=114 RepID=A0A2Z3HIV7_9BACT
MEAFDRITHNPLQMGGRPCIRGMRITVGLIVGMLAAGRSHEEILKAYPYLEGEDITQALAYAAWRLEEREQPLGATLPVSKQASIRAMD